jgi:hypothetical protein
MSVKQKQDNITATKLVVRVLQDVVSRQRFECYGDLTEALKQRCAGLKIPYAGLVQDAIDRLELGGKAPLISRPSKGRLSERPPEEILSRESAAAVVRMLMDRYRAERGQAPAPTRTMPTVRQTTSFQRERLKAARMVTAEIVSSVARCETLEADAPRVNAHYGGAAHCSVYTATLAGFIGWSLAQGYGQTASF